MKQILKAFKQDPTSSVQEVAQKIQLCKYKVFEFFFFSKQVSFTHIGFVERDSIRKTTFSRLFSVLNEDIEDGQFPMNLSK